MWVGNTQEFKTMTPTQTVYKLIGPVLVEQDQAEARGNVEKRLEFIKGEMYVVVAALSLPSFLSTTFFPTSSSSWKVRVLTFHN